jgi:hypothetical protein
MSAIVVKRMEADDVVALDAFLRECSDATAFHRPEWHEVIRRTYGHACDYWIARDGDTITGAFPVTHMRVPLLGAKLVAMPYQMYSGMPIGRDDARAPLIEAAIESAQRSGASYFEIRHHTAVDCLDRFGFEAVASDLVTTAIPLAGLELTRAEHGHRQRVRKAGRQGVEVVQATTLDELRTFRRMYLESGRGMGAPQAGWRLFAALHDLARPFYRLYLARHEGRTIGGTLVMSDGHVTFSRCSAHSTKEALALNAGPALWWHAMSDAAAAGDASFNCGITWVGDTGLLKWKEAWGGESRPVHIHVLPLRSKAPPAGGYFEGFNLAKTIWKKLPLPIVDRVGHQVTRWVG